MTPSSYQVEQLLKSLKRVQGIEQAARAVMPPAAPPAPSVPEGLPHPRAVADRSPLPEAVRLELERRAGSFMQPPPPSAVAAVPKAKRPPRAPKPPQRALGEGD